MGRTWGGEEGGIGEHDLWGGEGDCEVDVLGGGGGGGGGIVGLIFEGGE